MSIVSDFRVHYDAGSGGPGCLPAGLSLPNRLLGGTDAEIWSVSGPFVASGGLFRVARDDNGLWAYAWIPEALEDLQGMAHRAYLEIFGLLGGHQLYRVWNFVPEINAAGPDGLENYRRFCLGRATAFEAFFAGGSEAMMPAASAVGSPGRGLGIFLCAGRDPVRYFENPLQTPAYHYPEDYGPRPPSFARASLVERADGRDLFVSGTASIRGSETLFPHDTAAQLRVTMENLTEMVAMGGGKGRGGRMQAAQTRRFRVYIREESDYPLVRQQVEARLLVPGDEVAYIHADICRRDLMVEIEMLASYA